MNAINTATHLFTALATLTGANWTPVNFVGDRANEALLTVHEGNDTFTLYVHRGVNDWFVQTQINFEDDLNFTVQNLANGFRLAGYAEGANKL